MDPTKRSLSRVRRLARFKGVRQMRPRSGSRGVRALAPGAPSDALEAPARARAPHPRTARGRRAASALLALTLVACGDGSFELRLGSTLPVGTWGGEEAGLIVTESGAHVHIGCTFGDIQGEVPLDEDGRFTIEGSYVLDAFPVVTGPTMPAEFSGRVVGRALILSVAVSDTVRDRPVALGPVTVVYDEEPRLGPCPICRVPPQRTRAAPMALPEFIEVVAGFGGRFSRSAGPR